MTISISTILLSIGFLILFPPLAAKLTNAILDRLFEDLYIPNTIISVVSMILGAILIFYAEKLYFLSHAKTIAASMSYTDDYMLFILGLFLLLFGVLSIRNN